MNCIRLGFVSATVALFGTASAQYALFAAESTAGSLGGNTAAYGGVQQMNFSSSGGSFTMGPGLAASQVNDPTGLVYGGGKLYVGNRHGNTLGLGSVQSFNFDGTSLSGGTTLASASSPAHQGFHGFRFGLNSDLFVTTVNAGTRRFRDSGSGFVDIGGTTSGAVRDVILSADGSKMIETTIGNQLIITEVFANSFGGSTSFTVNGASAMHQMQMRGGSLYVTGFNSGTVHKVELDSQFNPTSSSSILNVNGAIGIAFSPDGQEMYVSGHTTNKISRYLASGSSWNANGEIATGRNMGYLAAVPEPGTLAALGLGALLGLRRRRR